MFDLRENFGTIASDALQEAFGVSSTVQFDIPVLADRGDLTTSVALQLAKKVGRPPQEIARAIADALQAHESVQSCEVAGPGYVNVTLSAHALADALAASGDACVPRATRTEEAPVIVEYSQPNIAKPLGIHHIIGTVIGQVTSNLHRFFGYNVLSWNYIGDWGTQFGKLAVAYRKWGEGKEVSSYSLEGLLALYVRFHDEAEKDPTLEDQGREAFRLLENGDEELRAFWKDVVHVTKSSLRGTYERLHVSFDLDLGESFYEDKMTGVIEEGKKKGVFTEGKEGALIVEFPEETRLPPYLVLKGDGATLYSTRDLAQMRYRIDTYHPQSILIFTDIAQKLHFEQLEETCRMLQWELPHFENVLFGRMRFVDASMSTRKGNILSLEHILDEAVSRAAAIIKERGDTIQTDDPEGLAEMMGVGALVYGILSQNRKMEIVFDWEKALTFEGNSAPYLQYTHARARSVLRKSGHEDVAVESDSYAQRSPLSASERSLILTLLRFDDALRAARDERMPHKLCLYLYELCQAYNAFYNDKPILKADEPERSTRLALTARTARTLKVGAELLTLRVPDRM